MLKQFTHMPRAVWMFIVYIWQRGQVDSVRQWAASLTYTTSLALIPLLAVIFSIFSAFNFDGATNGSSTVKDRILQNLIDTLNPQNPEEILGLFDKFLAGTASLTTVGVGFLIITSVLMLFTVNVALNRIFHIRKNQAMVPKLLMFWAVLTLVPLLLGAGFSVVPILRKSAALFGENAEIVNHWLNFVLNNKYILPTTLEFFALFILYIAVPNTSIPFKDAFWGTLITVLALELLKWGFSVYAQNSNINTIYGTLATVPIFLMWLFLFWHVILFGAVIIASLSEWRAGTRYVRQIRFDAYHQFHTALDFLYALWLVQKIGGRGIENKIIADHRLIPWVLHATTEVLEKQGWIQPVGDRGWVLARDLDAVYIYEVFELFMSARPQSKGADVQLWHHTLDGLVMENQRNRHELMSASIASLFNQQPRLSV